MSQAKLSLEVLNGPLDGQMVMLDSATEWSQAGDGLLSFPWDKELGAPQARFTWAEGQWWLEPVGGGRSTRYKGEPIKEKVALTPGDWLKAAETWLFVREIDEKDAK